MRLARIPELNHRVIIKRHSGKRALGGGQRRPRGKCRGVFIVGRCATDSRIPSGSSGTRIPVIVHHYIVFVCSILLICIIGVSTPASHRPRRSDRRLRYRRGLVIAVFCCGCSGEARVLLDGRSGRGGRGNEVDHSIKVWERGKQVCVVGRR